MKLQKLNEELVELQHQQRLDELNLGAFKALAKKVSKDIKKVYYNSIKGEQTPEAKKAMEKLNNVLTKSSLDKEWADEIFKDFKHDAVDLTREEVEFYIDQVQEADAYIKAKKAAEEAAKLEKMKKEAMLKTAQREFDRLAKLQARVKKHDSKIAKNRQKKIDTLKAQIEKLLKELEI